MDAYCSQRFKYFQHWFYYFFAEIHICHISSFLSPSVKLHYRLMCIRFWQSVHLFCPQATPKTLLCDYGWSRHTGPFVGFFTKSLSFSYKIIDQSWNITINRDMPWSIIIAESCFQWMVASLSIYSKGISIPVACILCVCNSSGGPNANVKLHFSWLTLHVGLIYVSLSQNAHISELGKIRI